MSSGVRTFNLRGKSLSTIASPTRVTLDHSKEKEHGGNSKFPLLLYPRREGQEIECPNSKIPSQQMSVVLSEAIGRDRALAKQEITSK